MSSYTFSFGPQVSVPTGVSGGFAVGEEVVITDQEKCARWNASISDGTRGIVVNTTTEMTPWGSPIYIVQFSSGQTWAIPADAMKSSKETAKKKKETQAPDSKLFKRIVISPEKVLLIEMALAQIDYQDLIFNQWGFGDVLEKGKAVSMLFYGPPGTGKTLMAQAIAERLGRKLKVIQTAEIESSEPGQAERNIKAYFEKAGDKTVLLFDECDSLISDRNEVGMILGAQINALLSGLELFDGVAIFTTNRLGRLDAAFERRVSAKVDFPMPNQEQRAEIWRRLIPKKAPIDKDVDFMALAEFEMAGGNIKNAVLSAARHAAFKKKKQIDWECFEVALKAEIEGQTSFHKAINAQQKVPRLGHGFSRAEDYSVGAGMKKVKVKTEGKSHESS